MRSHIWADIIRLAIRCEWSPRPHGISWGRNTLAFCNDPYSVPAGHSSLILVNAVCFLTIPLKLSLKIAKITYFLTWENEVIVSNCGICQIDSQWELNRNCLTFCPKATDRTSEPILPYRAGVIGQVVLVNQKRNRAWKSTLESFS